MQRVIPLRLALSGLIVAVSLGPMAILFPWVGSEGYALLLESRLSREEQLHGQIKGYLDGEVGRITDVLLNKSDPIAYTLAGATDRDLIDRLLDAIVEREDAIHDVTLVDRRGRLVAAKDRRRHLSADEFGRGELDGRLEGHAGQRLALDLHSPALATPLHGRVYRGSPVFRDGAVRFQLAVPVAQPNHPPLAILHATIDARELWRGIQARFQRLVTQTYLVDNRGSLLIPPAESEQPAGTLLTRMAIVRSSIGSRDWVKTEAFAGLSCSSCYGIVTTLDSLGWSVVSEVDESAVGGPIVNALMAIAVVVGIVMVASAVLSLGLASRLLEPMSALSRAFDRVARGDYPKAIRSSPVKEFNALWVGFGRMIGERKRAEEELRASNATMVEALGRENRAVLEAEAAVERLEVARRGAESANLAKSEFLANMSHEIRTPMTAILGFAEVMLDSDQSESERLECVHTIRRNGEGLLRIINDILDLSRVEAGGIDTRPVSCEPCAIIADVASLVRAQADAKGLSLQIEFDGPIPKTIHTDPTRLRQILINLIGNSIKFTQTGSIRVVTRLVGRAEDDRGGSPDEPSLQFDVIDTGPGIPEEEREGLFDPFTQADTSATRKFGGTGLGLTISRRFARLPGGDITVVETELGSGSTFRASVATGSLDCVEMVEDPLSRTALAGEADAVGQVARSGLHGTRILVAEDGLDNQRFIAASLRSAGADVTVEENGRLAFERALARMNARREGDPERPFDLILMDIQMPVMDGHEATAQLRQRGYTWPIVALSAHAMAGSREKCLAAGCDDFASKPIGRAELVDLALRWVGSAKVGHGSSA